MDPMEELTKQIEALTAQAGELKARLDGQADGETVAAVKAQLGDIEAKVGPLVAQREQAERDAEIKALHAKVDALINARGGKKFEWPTPNVNKGAAPDEPVAVTLWKARRGDHAAQKAVADWEALYDAAALKALSAGTGSAGGYLVPPEYRQQLVEFRRAAAPLRQYVTVVPGVNTNTVYVPRLASGLTVAWTAENATKTSSDETLAQIAVSIYTLAGIAKVSNQLLRWNSPAVDPIIRRDLGRGLGIEEDRAMIAGTGTGQPTGIINTAGITSTAASAQTALSIFDDVLAAIGRFQQNYHGEPDGILMNPRTYAKMLTAKDTSSRYIATGTIVGSRELPAQGAGGTTGLFLFGYPLILDANVPTALTVGANTNRSVIVVGRFEEAWLLEAEGIMVDVSDQAGTSFEANQTWFRGEELVGFTAARETTAFQIITDVGP